MGVINMGKNWTGDVFSFFVSFIILLFYSIFFHIPLSYLPHFVFLVFYR